MTATIERFAAATDPSDVVAATERDRAVMGGVPKPSPELRLARGDL